jgi:hypothetical protein
MHRPPRRETSAPQAQVPVRVEAGADFLPTGSAPGLIGGPWTGTPSAAWPPTGDNSVFPVPGFSRPARATPWQARRAGTPAFVSVVISTSVFAGFRLTISLPHTLQMYLPSLGVLTSHLRHFRV